MTRSASLFVVSLLLLVTACDDQCPRTQLEIRSFEGAPVAGTRVTCSGGAYHPLCSDAYGPPVTGPRYRTCAGPGLAVMASFVGLSAVVMYFDFNGAELRAVRAQYESACDDDGCELETTQAVGGWVMPESATPGLDGRQSGRFRVEFESFTVEGDYDTAGSVPLTDAGVP